MIHAITTAYRADVGDSGEAFGPHDDEWLAIASLVSQARLMPAADSVAQGCLPLELAHGWKMLRPVAAGQPVRWSDVAVDANSTAVKLRREMEELFREPARHAA